MPFLLLLVLALSCLQRQWPPPAAWLGQGGSALLTWSAIALFGSAAWVAAQRWDRRLQRDPGSRSFVLRRYAAFRRWHAALLVVTYFLLVCFGGWGWLVGDNLARGEVVAPGFDLILLLPLLGGLAMSWAAYHPLERSLALTGFLSAPESFPGRWSYIALQARQNCLLAAPPLVLMFLWQMIVAAWPDLLHNSLVLPLVCVGLLGAMYAAVPLLLRLLLGLKPLPDGPLRQGLTATASRLSFQFSDIVVWNTRRTIANAMVTGPLPALRYVILTDRLIEELTPEEIEAVFGHEVGHIKHHHLPFYFAFLLSSLLALIGLWELLLHGLDQIEAQTWLQVHWPVMGEWLASYQILSALPLLTLLGLYIFVVFGFLSRRCERQADLHGCRTASTQVFIDALEKVARLNGINRDRPGLLQSWQHSSIAKRVTFLEKTQAEPDLEQRFQRRVGLVKWGVIMGLAALLTLLICLEPSNVWAVLGM